MNGAQHRIYVCSACIVHSYCEVTRFNPAKLLTKTILIHVNHISVQNDAQGEVLVNIPGFNVTDPDSRQFGTEGVRMSFAIDPECPLLIKEHKGYVNSNLQ